MNPYSFVLSDFYPNSNFDVESAAAVLLLRVMADGYSGDMPTGSNPYRWVWQQLSQRDQSNAFVIKLSADWYSRS